MPAETTIQADVGPGDQTGVYYITICNLPFGTSWQQLKDWTRTTCTVDHIEVFQNSTSGWVRVMGRDNFEKAWGLLNGGVFNGRSIIASDRNRSHSIKIKELLVDPKQGVYSHTPRYQTPATHITHPKISRYRPTPQGPPLVTPTSPVASPRYPTTSCGQYYLGSYPHASASGYATQPITPHNMTRHPSTATTPMQSTYAASEAGSFYTTHSDSSGGAQLAAAEAAQVTYPASYQFEGATYTIPYRVVAPGSEVHAQCTGYVAAAAEAVNGNGSGNGHGNSNGNGNGNGNEYISTEQRKIHISPFPQQARVEEVTAWIRRKVGLYDIEKIDVPQNSNSRYLRGHALVIFENATEASHAVDLLSKARFQGRRVTSRFTVEGVTAAEQHAVAVVAAAHYIPSSGDSPYMSSMYIPTGPSNGRSREHHHSGERSSRPKKRHGSEKKSSSSSSSSKKGSHGDKGESSSRSKTSEKRSSSTNTTSTAITTTTTTATTTTGGGNTYNNSGCDNSRPVVVDGTSRKRDKR